MEDCCCTRKTCTCLGYLEPIEMCFSEFPCVFIVLDFKERWDTTRAGHVRLLLPARRVESTALTSYPLTLLSFNSSPLLSHTVTLWFSRSHSLTLSLSCAPSCWSEAVLNIHNQGEGGKLMRRAKTHSQKNISTAPCCWCGKQSSPHFQLTFWTKM